MKIEECKDCMWRDGKVCTATNKQMQTRYVRAKNCFDKILKIGSKLPEPEKERYTCNDCPDNKDCEFAFDLYNLDGDCLATK